VRVRLRRETDPGIVNHHDYLYEVERINKSLSGAVELDLMHFPIDVNGRSVVALYVAGATINGFEYPTGRGSFTCDVNDPEDEDPIPDEGGDPPGLPPDLPDDVDPDPESPEWPADVPTPEFPVGNEDPDNPDNDGGRDAVPGGGGTGGVSNPSDPIDSVPDSEAGGGGSIGGIPPDRPLLPGDEITNTPPCPGGTTDWYKVCPDGTTTKVAEDEAIYIIQNGDQGCEIYAESRCPDPGQPDGFGTGLPSSRVPIGTGGTLIGSPGIYSISWVKHYRGLSFTPSALENPALVFGNRCSDDSTIGIFEGDVFTDYTETFGTGPWGSVAYGIRAYSAKLTLEAACENDYELQDYIVIELLTSGGTWVKFSSSDTIALAGKQIFGVIGFYGLSTYNEATNIELREL
jgi:hypothetical protein